MNSNEPSLSDQLAAEEAKRNRVFDSVEQWRAFQQFLTWAARQRTAPDHSPAGRHAEEQRKLADMARYRQDNHPDE